MKNFTRLLFTGMALLLFSGIGMAQTNSQVVKVVGKLVRVTPKLADIDNTTMYGEPLNTKFDPTGIKEKVERVEEKLEEQFRRNSRRGASLGIQKPNNYTPNTPGTTLGVHFDGMTWSGFDPSDNNLAVGPNHVIQIINFTKFEIWNKSGTVIQGPTNFSSITGLAGSGDPVVLYDQLADRWLMSEFGPGSCCNELIVAVSKTPDPTGQWSVYSYTDASFFPDYPKYSVWHNAYYATTNDFNTAGTALLGSSVWAFDRAAMIAGNATATMLRSRQNFSGQANYNMGTVCLEGTNTSSQSGLFIYPDGASNLGIFEFTPNFAGGTATVGPVTMIPVTAYSQPPGGVAQQGTGTTVPTLGSRMMFRMNYRNIGGTESIVCSHSVGGSGGLAAVRWYELRHTGGTWGVYQQGTLDNPDGNSRFMPSITMDQSGSIAMSYDLSGTTSFPSIKYTGRQACDPLNQMTLPEQTIVNGTGAHVGCCGRWGDYNTCVCDPVTPGSFWGTSEYSSQNTHMFNFSLTNTCNSANIIAGTANITAESCSPFNNILDPNETVTVNFCLQNTGSVNTTNLVGTLQATGGVTSPSGPQTYGVVTAGGAPVCRSFSFTAGSVACGSTITATIQLQDGATNLGTITYNFLTGTVVTNLLTNGGFETGDLTNWTIISSNPAPVVNNTSPHTGTFAAFLGNLPGTEPLGDASMYHTLAVPAGGATLSFWWKGFTQDGITFDWQDAYITNTSGTILATIMHNCSTNNYTQKTYNLAAFAGQTVRVEFLVHQDGFGDVTNMYVDDVALISSVCCAGCSPSSITTQPINVASCATSTVSFSVVGTGSVPLTYQWQESTDGGATWNNITNGGIYSGATTATLTLTGITGGMNGYQYRSLVTSPCGGPATSNAATLTILTQSVGGTTSPANVIVCSAPNSGTITLAGQTGNVIRWEFSIDNGVTWTPITNTTNTLNWSNVVVTTLYRAVVQVPGCTAVTSTSAAVTVSAVGLAIIGDRCTNLCQGDGVTLTANDVVLAPTTASMNQPPTSTNATITLNFRNNNAFPVVITGLSSMCNFQGATNVSAYYKASAINGAPGQITPANGWNQFGSSQITSLGAGTVQPFPCVSLTVPAGATYGILVQAVTTANGNNIVYNNANVGVTTVSAGGCDLITGTNIGYAGGPVPSAPTVTPRYFIGSISFRSVGVPITIGTFQWAPATGLNVTNTNPVAAAPATTTTYTVTHNNGSGCIRTGTITITVNQRPVVTANPVNTTVCATTTATFTAAGTGTNLTYQWQESRDGGVTYVPLLEVAPYSGTATATLTINPVTVAMNNYLYRCVLGGACTPYIPPTNITTGAKLTVNPLPVVTVSPTGPVCGGIAGTNGTKLTASGADSYSWSPVTGLFTDAATTNPYTGTNVAIVYAAPTALTTYTVTGTNATTGCTNTATVLVNYTPPAPSVTPTNVVMCLGDPAVKLKSSSSQSFTGTFPSTTGNNTAIPDGPPVPPNPPPTYPATVSTATVSGIPAGATITGVRVKVNITHGSVSDMVIALKAPNGSVLNLDASIGGTWGAGSNLTNTVFSSAGSTALSAGAPPYTGTFKPDAAGATFTMFGFTFPGGPVGFVPTVNNFPALYSTPNGVWSLGMYDNSQGGTGTFTNFSIDIDYVVGVPSTPATWTPAAGLFSDPAATIPYVAGTAVDSVWTRPTPGGSYTYQATVNSVPFPPIPGCTSPSTTINVTVNTPITVTAQPVSSTLCTDKSTSFSVTVTGTSPTYQWQVSTNNGTTWANITNGSPYSGATTRTLTITAPAVSYNGYLYRCVITGAAPCGSATSTPATLTVNPLPTVVISASPYRNLFPSLRTTITATSTPAAATYNWSRNGSPLVASSQGLISGLNTNALLIDVDGMGTYQVNVTDVNGCVNNSNTLVIGDSVSSKVFIYPNPNSGQFQVRYDPTPNNVLPRGINVYNAMGQRLFTQYYSLGLPYARMDVNLKNLGAGVYWLEVVDVNNVRLAVGRVEVLR